MSNSNNDQPSDPDEPKVTASAVACEFPIFPCKLLWLQSFFGKSKIILDPEVGVIYFKNCFVPYGFLTRRVRGWYACDMSDIQSVVIFQPNGRRRFEYSLIMTLEYIRTHCTWYMLIDTAHGKVDNISCMINDATWTVGKYLEEYIRHQEKESPRSRLKTQVFDISPVETMSQNYYPLIKMFFLTSMSLYGIFLSFMLSNKIPNTSGLFLAITGFLGGFIGWIAGLLIYYILAILLPEKIIKSQAWFSCVLLLTSFWPAWVGLYYLALNLATETYEMLISPLVVSPEDEVFWFSVIGVVGLTVALSCGVLIRSIFRNRQAVKESLQASELSGPEN
ncbi:MAG: hypothetical protein EBS30_00255 [Planctomycetes bacterium]|nr:hypothetical protein [Planctomycetota bacterium]